ncbi:hypothetical protein ACJW30_07G014700 [Castanea mollissima]
MKKKVKRYTEQIEVGSQNHYFVLKDFSRLLDCQIEKIVLFLLEKQGLLATRLSNLGEQHHALIQQSDGSRISELQEAYRAVGQELLRLLFFVEMNAIGIRKILKKIDKRFGYKFTDYYVKTRANHPYSQLRQVFKHVDPIIDSIKTAVDRLSNSTNFLHFLGRHAFIMEDELPTPFEDESLEQRYHFMSLLLNLANTFLYMVNTYIIVPTADDYSLSLGAAATVCGVVIGSMAVAQVFSSVYFSAWSNRSYLRPLVFSSIVLFVGNALYALAYDLNSITVLLIGRLFCGLGSARAINRRYISDCVPLKLRMQASAGFVSASALGMACGPALACLLQTKFKIYKLTFNEETLPGWLMALAWLVYLLWLWISFREPHCETKENLVPNEANADASPSCLVQVDSGRDQLTAYCVNGEYVSLGKRKGSIQGEEECSFMVESALLNEISPPMNAAMFQGRSDSRSVNNNLSVCSGTIEKKKHPKPCSKRKKCIKPVAENQSLVLLSESLESGTTNAECVEAAIDNNSTSNKKTSKHYSRRIKCTTDLGGNQNAMLSSAKPVV